MIHSLAELRWADNVITLDYDDIANGIVGVGDHAVAEVCGCVGCKEDPVAIWSALLNANGVPAPAAAAMVDLVSNEIRSRFESARLNRPLAGPPDGYNWN